MLNITLIVWSTKEENMMKNTRLLLERQLLAYNQAVGFNLRFLRKKYKITQKEIATATGRTQQSFSRYETGKTIIPVAIICIIHKRYGIPLEEFFLGFEIK